MEDETIKYSKTENDLTINVFENFEPYHCGERAIPKGYDFLNTDGDGYQKYTSDTVGAEIINAVDSKGNQLFTINGAPIKGCKKGTVVTARQIASGNTNVEIWIENNKTYYKEAGANKTELTDSDGIPIRRLGVAIVGGGGASGEGKCESWKNDCHTFDNTMPGGGGGGGATVWGIINLDQSNKDNKFLISVGSGGSAKSANGADTTLSLKSVNGYIAVAGGGSGGKKGTKKGASGGAGGKYSYTRDTNYFIFKDGKNGGDGGSYSEVNVDNEDQVINTTVENNEFEIIFLPDGNKKLCGSGSHPGIGATVKDIAQASGKVVLAVPGGNSLGTGSWSTSENTSTGPSTESTLGGGGMSWTWEKDNGSSDDSYDIWRDGASAKEKSCRCGAKGCWFLFY